MSEEIVSRKITASEFEELGKAIRQNVDEHEDAPNEMSGPNWKGQIDGFCPVQGFGKINIDGNVIEWYFRARHDNWSMEFGTSETPEKYRAYYEGDYDDASWMYYSDAWDLITECCDKYSMES